MIKQKNRGGSWQYRYMCQNCEYKVPKYVKIDAIQKAGLDPDLDVPTMPIAGERRQCEVCKADGAQIHHWAPWAIFGDEAEDWPQSHLCPDCHTRWHQLVTPNIGQRKK